MENLYMGLLISSTISKNWILVYMWKSIIYIDIDFHMQNSISHRNISIIVINHQVFVMYKNCSYGFTEVLFI